MDCGDKACGCFKSITVWIATMYPQAFGHCTLLHLGSTRIHDIVRESFKQHLVLQHVN